MESGASFLNLMISSPGTKSWDLAREKRSRVAIVITKRLRVYLNGESFIFTIQDHFYRMSIRQVSDIFRRSRQYNSSSRHPLEPPRASSPTKDNGCYRPRAPFEYSPRPLCTAPRLTHPCSESPFPNGTNLRWGAK